MILAGVDEAGLGPVLGPLVTAAAALSVPDSWDAAAPWDHLEAVICRSWRKKETRTAVADSKAVYRTGGIEVLEAAVAAFCRLTGAAAPEIVISEQGSLPRLHECYSLTLQPFPAFMDADAAGERAREIEAGLGAYGAAAVHLEAAVLYEPVLNRRYGAGLNKSEALLREIGGHITRLAAKFPREKILLIVDKQGGRNQYAPFLMSLFPGAWLETLENGAAVSSYRLRRPGGDILLHFRAKADAGSFPTALASMTAKYARERAMAEFNRWFCGRMETLRPTAGYPEDAARWLAEVRDLAGEAAEALRLGLVIRER